MTSLLMVVGLLLMQPTVPNDQDIELRKQHVMERRVEWAVQSDLAYNRDEAWSVDWDVLAQCESHGEWDYGPHSGWGSGLYHGGLQFDPGTWSEYREPDMPSLAYNATPHQQKHVAERVLAVQGLIAWPACTRRLGWR